MNDIKSRQSDPQSIQIAAAFRGAYKKAKQWKAFLWCSTFALSIIQIAISLNLNFIEKNGLSEQLAGTFVITALLVMTLSTFGQELGTKKYTKNGSNLQRLHDYKVLKIGQRPGSFEIRASKIEKLGSQWLRKNPKDKRNLEEWWPDYTSKLPEPLSQALCLMATFNWEYEIRSKYLYTVILIIILSLAGLVTIAIAFSMTTESLIINLITPSSPFIALAISEALSTLEVKENAKQCSKEISKLWDTKNRLKSHEIREQVQELVFLWQSYRSASTPIFDWLYWLTQKAMNTEMLIDTERLVDEYLEKK